MNGHTVIPSLVILPTDPPSVQNRKSADALLMHATPEVQQAIRKRLIDAEQKKHHEAAKREDWKTATAALEEMSRLQAHTKPH